MAISLNPSTLLSGDGLDVNSLVSQILNQKSGQLVEWQMEQVTLQGQAGLLGLINNDLNNLASAVTALSDPLGALTEQAATSSNTAVLTASADSTAPAGNHTIVVNNLASAGLVYTDSVAGGADVSILPTGEMSGDLKMQIGGNGGSVADIQITAGSNDTLNKLSDAINQQSTENNWGIMASVVTDANGARLAITSTATGTPGALAITGNTTVLNFSAPSGGTNAALTVDGISYSSASNTIGGAISGVTLNLEGAAPGSTVQLTVGPDTGKAMDAITTFVNAYNAVVNDINSQFAVNASTNTQGPLGSDSALRVLQSILLQDVTFSVTGNDGLVNLAALGINMNDDGTLTMGTTPDGKSVSEVMDANPSAFLSFFQNATSTGFANAFHADLTNLTDPTEGLINVDLAQNKQQQQNVSDSISNFGLQLTAQQTQLTQQFSRVNASLQAYPLLLAQITQILATMDLGSSSKSSS